MSPILNSPHREQLPLSKGVKEVQFSMWYQGTEGTDNSLSCIISFGPHSNPVRGGTVVINIKFRLKSRIKCLGNSGGIPDSRLIGQMSPVTLFNGNLLKRLFQALLAFASLCVPEGLSPCSLGSPER